MSSSQGSGRDESAPDLLHAARPFTALEAARAEEEARQRALETSEQVIEHRRQGRVEAESHRISEEMTRRAQEAARARAAQQAQSEELPLPVPTTEALPVTGAGDQTTPMLPRGVAIKRVIVPLSGAPFAERALPYARAVVRLTGATLALVHVGDALPPSPAALLERVVDTLIPSADQRDQTEDDEEPLRLLRGRGAPTTATTHLLDLSSGSVTQGLLDLEARDGTDMVVLATRRHPGAEGDTLGTVARALIRRGRAPVLLICPQVAVPEDAIPTFGRILVPLDGSPLAEHALAPLFALAGSTLSDATVGEGVCEIVLFSVIDSWRVREDAVRYLNRIGHELQSALGKQVQIGVAVELGSAPGAIVAAAARGGPQAEGSAPFDLVALATHGRGGIKHWLFGSVAEYVLSRSPVPVLVVHPEEEDI